MVLPSRTVLLAAWAVLTASAGAQYVRDTAVEIEAAVTEEPPAITLSWPATNYPVIRQELHKRVEGTAAWRPLAVPLGAAEDSFTDTEVETGRGYEYRIVRYFEGEPYLAVGYLCAGMRAPVPDERGRVVLLVEESLSEPLAAEIGVLCNDLLGEGWSVVRREVPASMPPPQVRALIGAAYGADPARTNTVMILGHVAVPYSGRTAPDMHDNHLGAWPTDAYYADVDGTWPDTTVEIEASVRYGNYNVPGDGKFDPSFLDGDRAPELAVGRIDFSDLPGAAWNEVELTRRYLARDHAYRHQLPPYDAVPRRALIDDQFGLFFWEAFAANGWRSFSALVGGAQCAEGAWLSQATTQPYLLAYGCGAGNMEEAGGVITSTDFYTTPSRVVFNVLFGSFFGDWDYTDNLLRASLAGPDGSLGLAAFWGGRPQVPLHLLGGGRTLGECLRAARLNAGDWGTGYLSGIFARGVQINLLGDPTLSFFPVAEPTDLVAAASPGAVSLSWNAPVVSGIEGYIVSRASAPEGPYARLRRELVTSTSYVDRSILPGATGYYRVRPVVRAGHPGGTMLVPGQSAFASAVAGDSAAEADLRVTGNGLPVANQDPRTDPSNNTMANGPRVIEFTVANAGSAPLVLSPPTLAGPGATQFRIVGDPPSVVGPGQSSALDVEFAPTVSGTAQASVSLISNDADESPFSICLEGVEAAPSGSLRFTPAIAAFGLEADTTSTRSVLVENPGPEPVEFALTNPFDSYRVLGSGEAGGPAFVWNDISASGAAVAFSDADDSVSEAIPIGFVFPFGGTGRTSFRICTNGYLTFSEAPASVANPPLPNAAAPPDLIAGFWQDLILLEDSVVQVESKADECTIQFTDAAMILEYDRRVSFQIVLHADGRISLFYDRVDLVPEFAVAGVQESFATRGFKLAGPPHALEADTIYPPGYGAWLEVGPTTATLPAGGSLTLNLTLDSTAAGPGPHALDLPADTGDPATSIILPVGLDVGPAPSPRAAWRLAGFGEAANAGTGADAADPDGDGFPNLIEYATGTDPLDGSSRPSLGLEGGQLRLRHLSSLRDIDLTVQFSNDLATWSDGVSSLAGGMFRSLGMTVLDDSGEGDVMSAAMRVPPPPVFLRVRVDGAGE